MAQSNPHVFKLTALTAPLLNMACDGFHACIAFHAPEPQLRADQQTCYWAQARTAREYVMYMLLMLTTRTASDVLALKEGAKVVTAQTADKAPSKAARKAAAPGVPYAAHSAVDRSGQSSRQQGSKTGKQQVSRAVATGALKVARPGSAPAATAGRLVSSKHSAAANQPTRKAVASSMLKVKESTSAKIMRCAKVSPLDETEEAVKMRWAAIERSLEGQKYVTSALEKVMFFDGAAIWLPLSSDLLHRRDHSNL
jgi:hypothetical protein